MYRQFHPRANMSIECNTSEVPCDGKYYVIKDKIIIATFRNLKAATACYQQLVDEMALPPLVQETKVSADQVLDDYYLHASNNALMGTNFGPSKGRKTGRFKKSR